jgi:hypothetical protein
MPYQGETVSVEEMLDILIDHERTEATGAIELGRALEDKAIKLFARAGSNDDGGELWREISNAETSAIVALLRDLCNRARITTIGTYNLPLGLFGSARAIRIQFETACRLVELMPEPERMKTKGPAPGTVDRYGESDRARFPEVEALMKVGKTLTAATNELGPTLEGPATPESKARRLRDLFQKVKAAN